MGGACSTYRKEEWCTQGLCDETRGKEPTWKTKAGWKDNIKMDFKEVGCEGVDLIELAQGRDRWRASLSVVMNIRVPFHGVS